MVCARLIRLGCLCSLLLASCAKPQGGLRVRSVLARDGLIYAVALHPQGIAAIELRLRAELVIYRQEAPAVRVDLGPSEYDVDDLHYDPHRRWLWTASADGRVRAFDLQGREQRTLRLGLMASAVASNSQYLAIGSRGGSICLRDLLRERLLQCAQLHGDRVSSLVMTEDALISASWDGAVHVLSLPGMTVLNRRVASGSANHIALDQMRHRIAIARSARPPLPGATHRPGQPSGERGDAIELCTLDGGTLQGCHLLTAAHRGPVTAVAFAGNRLVSGGWDSALRVWDLATGRQLHTLQGFAYLVRDVVSSPSGIAVAAWARTPGTALSIVELTR
jgi:WD40 repeat protein